ncbi:hypothetical protein HAX54_033641 [Datura stramonium]|uniref:Ulp1 protease family, C-terminal catalytic domain containing protein n=1 Tax=Datura stramonium TaxID=4076 RepID=A0ABS8SDJ7_DATST|nr:hypothetical protein [Datura stramonium]
MDVQPIITTTKCKEKVVLSTSPSKNRIKQQTTASPRSMGSQPHHVVNPSIKKMSSIQPMKYASPKKKVKDEFDNIRKLINDKFNSLMDVVRVDHEDEKVIIYFSNIQSAGHDAIVKSKIAKLSKLLPIYLSTTDFYKEKGITSSTHRRNCGIFVAAYVEFLSGGEGIPNSSIDVELMRNRYASILWDYATKKLEAESMIDDKTPPKKIKPVVEFSSNYRIVLS